MSCNSLQLSSPFFLSVADVFCSLREDSLIVDESVGSVEVALTINREVETPFVCTIETRPMSAEGVYTLQCSVHWCMSQSHVFASNSANLLVWLGNTCSPKHLPASSMCAFVPHKCFIPLHAILGAILLIIVHPINTQLTSFIAVLQRVQISCHSWKTLYFGLRSLPPRWSRLRLSVIT